MRILLSAGHGRSRGMRDPGAVNPRLGIEEHMVCIGLATEAAKYFAQAGHVVTLMAGPMALSGKIALVNREHDNKPLDWAIEFHLNSFADSAAHGTEVLYLADRNEATAKRMSRLLSDALDTFDRGAVRRDNLGWLTKTRPRALIVETLFVSNNEEAPKILDPGFDMRVANAVLNAVTEEDDS